MTKITRFCAALTTVALLATAGCTGGSGSSKEFAGTYIDEFGNRFELRSDYSASVQFAGHPQAVETTWSDGEQHDRPFATINYNGDPEYYFMRDGALYRHREDMDRGTTAIKIEKQ